MSRYLGAALALAVASCASTSRVPEGLRYRRIVLSPEAVPQPLLEGPPQTAGMRDVG